MKFTNALKQLCYKNFFITEKAKILINWVIAHWIYIALGCGCAIALQVR